MDQFSEEIGEESQIDIRHYLRVVRKRKWTIIAVFVILVLTVVINDFTKVPIYEASARMIIEKSNPNVVSIQEVMAFDSWDPDYKETQFRIIQSRSVARSVIKKMNLADSEEFKPQPAQGIMANFRNLISNFLRGIKDRCGPYGFMGILSLFTIFEKPRFRIGIFLSEIFPYELKGFCCSFF